MIAQRATIPETLKKEQISFQEILSDDELTALFAKHGVQDKRQRKLFVRCFFWLMIFSAGEASHRGSLLSLIGFFIGAMAQLYPEVDVTTISKAAVSKRLVNVSWYLFRGVYNHLLERYKKILDVQDVKFLGQFSDAFLVDGSVIALHKGVESVFKSVHQGHASLKLNTKFSLKSATVTKLQVTSGKQHDSRFSFVTKEANCLYLVDLGYWAFGLMKKIVDAGSFFVMRLKGSCDPLIVKVATSEFQHLVGKRLSEINDFLTEQTAVGEIDLTVQLSKAKKPHFQEDIRLVGLFHEAKWRFYVTNLFDLRFTPHFIYELYAQRWQVEIFFNLIKNVLALENIVSKTKNGIMIEIYSALILYLFTRIVIALAAKKIGRSLHEFSFERTQKLIRGFLLTHFHLFLLPSLQAVERLFQQLVDMAAAMGLAASLPYTANLNQHFA